LHCVHWLTRRLSPNTQHPTPDAREPKRIHKHQPKLVHQPINQPLRYKHHPQTKKPPKCATAHRMDNSPFSKLSKELRDMIYEYTLPDPQDIVDISRGQTPPIVITQLCSQMREEAQRASSTPYKLSIGAPPDLVEESGYHVPLPTHLDRLLERGTANVHRLPFLFRSKPTTIELHVVVVVGRGCGVCRRAPHLIRGTRRAQEKPRLLRGPVEAHQNLSSTLHPGDTPPQTDPRLQLYVRLAADVSR
jgi:hypothetical protein